MTVNEALYESGLYKSYDKTLMGKKVDKLISILTELGLDRASIKPIIESYNLIMPKNSEKE